MGARENNDVGVYDVNGPVLDADFIIEYIQKHFSGYIVQLSGGEPLTHPAIEYIVREISKTNKIIICTNGELIPLHIRLLENKDLIWRISYHPEFRNGNFLDIINLVMCSGSKYIINYVCHPRHIESGKVIDYINDIRDYNYEVSEFEGRYKNYIFRSVDNVYDDFRTPHNQISFDLEMVVIQPNGLLYSCHGRTDNAIGDVYKNEFNGGGCNMNCKVDNKSLCQVYNSITRIMNYYYI